MSGVKSLLKKVSPAAVQVVSRLVQNGYEAYLVGGAVRDLLLGCEPKDYDITTDATPEEVRTIFGRRNCMVIGRRFRLAQVRVGAEEFEVSTFRRKPTQEERKGRYEDDGVMIWSDNEFGTLEDDVQRRDFTVNALYMDLVGTRGIIDYTGGIQDLKAGIVRTVGDPEERFEEDPVRMLRALKLVGQHGFKLEAATAAALERKRGMITLSSVARLYEELLKIFFTGKSLRILTAFHEHGFLMHFWPMMDEIWDKADGMVARRLLKLRDEALSSGDYSHSKALALATACLPVALRAMCPADGEEENVDIGDRGRICLNVVRDFYGMFVVPRLYTIRVKEILMLIPLLSSPDTAYKGYHNREYVYGKLLLTLFVKAMGWSSEIYESLPDPDTAMSMKRRRRRR